MCGSTTDSGSGEVLASVVCSCLGVGWGPALSQGLHGAGWVLDAHHEGFTCLKLLLFTEGSI